MHPLRYIFEVRLQIIFLHGIDVYRKLFLPTIIFVGEDLDVLMALCDRLLVLSNGHVTGIVDPRQVSKEEIGLLMTRG